MKIVNKKITPENVTKLSSCEIFVFGSNLAGEHLGGAAKFAYEEFGAEWGVGSGPTGRCYAIPTMHGDLESIRPYAEEFIRYAKEHPVIPAPIIATSYTIIASLLLHFLVYKFFLHPLM